MRQGLGEGLFAEMDKKVFWEMKSSFFLEEGVEESFFAGYWEG